MIYRKAKIQDIPAIVEIAVISVSNNPLPVNIDREAMARMAQACINPAVFGACVQKSFWYDKMQCSVLLYYSLVKGAGLKLIREFAAWVKGRSAIKVAVLSLEPDVDPRLVRFLKHLGFTRETVTLSYVRGI